MWVQSPSNKFTGLIALSLLFASAANASQGKIGTDPLLKYQGDATTQSLYAMHEEAQKFLNLKRPDRDPRIDLVGPDIREQYPRCAVPLTMRWRHESTPYEIDLIDVICARTDVKHTPSWETTLSVFEPVAHAAFIARQKKKAATGAKKD
jgi:hypothetical protein